jgi:DNA-binding MarR family transcriptional regulator
VIERARAKSYPHVAVNLRNLMPNAAPAVGPEGRLYLVEDELDRSVALLFLAARRFYAAAEGPLAVHGLGDAHYRALATIRRNEGLSIGALMAELGVVKQSLARVLGELEAAGFIVRAPGLTDRRARRLLLTDAGREAERAVSAALRERISAVFRAAGADAVMGARTVLAALADSPQGS